MKSRVLLLAKDVSLELQWIPPGEFLMGSPRTENGHEETESPQHTVRFTKGFWMSRSPVTQNQWLALMGSNPSKFVDPCQPVEMVSWHDAQEFIARINVSQQGTFGIPTEAQWEYACRAGTTTRFYSGDDECFLESAAWFGPNSDGHPHPVGGREPNQFGLYDMHGNVFEWTADWFGAYPEETAVDPVGPSSGTKKVLRGGCCLCDANNCRAANRYEKDPDGKNFNIGFRIVMLTESDDQTRPIQEKEDIAMKKIQIYDPPMCCSTGVCGPSVDETLVRFSADLDWLKRQGVAVERYNLSQQPAEFVANSLVKDALSSDGNDCLPLIVVDGVIAQKGSYPSRRELAQYAGISLPKEKPLMTETIRELVAIGAAIACNCETCFKFHYDKARKLGVLDEDMLEAVEMGLKVKSASSTSIQELAYKYLKKNEDPENPDNRAAACGPGCSC